MTRRFFTMAIVAAVAAASQADTLYGIDSVGFSGTINPGLYTINESTGAATFDQSIIGSSGQVINTSIIGAAYLNGNIYIADAFDTNGPDAFGSVDPTTGVFTPISGEEGGINWWTLASDTSNNVLYTIEGDSGAASPEGSLLSIDPTTGAATDVGLTLDSNGDPIFLNDLAFDTRSGTLYGWGGQTLYTVNTMTGILAAVGNSTSISPANNGDMTYDPSNDTLFYNDGSTLYSIDKATGLETLIGPNNSGVQLDGLAVVPSTPEPVSLVSFAVLGGVGYLRRRRAAKN